MKKIFTLAIALVLGAMTNFASAGSLKINGDDAIMMGYEYGAYLEGYYNFYFNEETSTLYLKNSVNEIQSIEYIGNDELTIMFDGRNSINNASIRAYNLVFAGDGFLDITGTIENIIYGYKINFESGNVRIANTSTESGYRRCVYSYGGGVSIQNEASLIMSAKGEDPEILYAKTLNLGSSIAFNKDSYQHYSGNWLGHSVATIRDVATNKLVGDVMITNKNKFYAVVNGKNIVSSLLNAAYNNNNSDIDANGVKFKFNPVTGEMTLKSSINTSETTALTLNVNTVLELSGNITLKGQEKGVYCTKGVIIKGLDNTKKTISGGQYGIHAWGGDVRLEDCALSVNGNTAAIKGTGDMSTSGCYFMGSVFPDRGKEALCYHPNTVYSGEPVKDLTVEKGTLVNYGIVFAGIPVTNANAEQVLMDQRVMYSPATGLLKIQDVNVDCGDDPLLSFYSSNQVLKVIHITGENVAKTGNTGIRFEYTSDASLNAQPLTFEGDGTLKMDGQIRLVSPTKLKFYGYDKLGVIINTNAENAIYAYNPSSTIEFAGFSRYDLSSSSSCIAGFNSFKYDYLGEGITYDTASKKLMENGKDCKHLISSYYAGIEMPTLDATKNGVFKHMENGKLVIEKDGKKFNAAGAHM